MSILSGKYRLDARLGGGGMAEVFVGSMVGAEGFSRRVAIKRVLPGFCDNPAFGQMFVAEAKISSRLQHPNIVSILDFDRDADNRLYLVMELVDGKDLDAVVATGPLPAPIAIYVIGEVLRGLGHAHDLPVVEDSVFAGSETVRSIKGVVHRAVSPHNVLLSWEGAVKVSDFGIAKARTASSATASEMIKGKPAYMSPEQANGEQLDGRSDLFAVGIMLWELLCGRRLFVGEDTRSLIAAVMFRPIPRPRSVRGDVPKDLDRIVMRLLERDRGVRYATAEQALADLLACESSPKDGSAQLRRLLAERFPAQAPVRHSVLQSRSGESARLAMASAALAPRAATAQGASGSFAGASQPVAASSQPLVAAVHRGRWPLVVIGSVLAIVVVIGVVLGQNGSRDVDAGAEQTAAASDSAPQLGSGDPDAHSSAPAVVQLDARVAAAPVIEPVLALDAGVDAVARRQPVRPSPSQATRVDTSKQGRLQVSAFPALTVYIDKKRIHDTPIDKALPVGRHSIRLVNKDVGHDETLTVTIHENRTTTIHRD